MLVHDFLTQILTHIQGLQSPTEIAPFHWYRMVSDLTADIVQFVELTTLVQRALSMQNVEVLQGAKESHVHLLFIIKGMNQACQKEDALALEDLIKYELKDNLTQWKIDLIPRVRRHLGI
jgi:hypothetical protein